jgi:hypothetical protein
MTVKAIQDGKLLDYVVRCFDIDNCYSCFNPTLQEYLANPKVLSELIDLVIKSEEKILPRLFFGLFSEKNWTIFQIFTDYAKLTEKVLETASADQSISRNRYIAGLLLQSMNSVMMNDWENFSELMEFSPTVTSKFLCLINHPSLLETIKAIIVSKDRSVDFLTFHIFVCLIGKTNGIPKARKFDPKIINPTFSYDQKIAAIAILSKYFESREDADSEGVFIKTLEDLEDFNPNFFEFAKFLSFSQKIFSLAKELFLTDHSSDLALGYLAKFAVNLSAKEYASILLNVYTDPNTTNMKLLIAKQLSRNFMQSKSRLPSEVCMAIKWLWNWCADAGKRTFLPFLVELRGAESGWTANEESVEWKAFDGDVVNFWVTDEGFNRDFRFAQQTVDNEEIEKMRNLNW